jgi:hypothetical protein
LSDEALATLRRRAEEALAQDGVDRTHLRYEVLVKPKVDDILEQEDRLADVSAPQGEPTTSAMEC